MALPLGELSPQATERVLAVAVYPLRLRFAQPPLPKGEARNVRKEVFWRKTLALCLCKICKTRPGRRQIRPGLCRKKQLVWQIGAARGRSCKETGRLFGLRPDQRDAESPFVLPAPLRPSAASDRTRTTAYGPSGSGTSQKHCQRSLWL